MGADTESHGPPEKNKFSRTYTYVRSLQLEGGGMADVGASLVTVMRVARLFGNALKEDWPDEPKSWPPVEPPDIDVKARKFRLPFYCRARNEAEIKRFLGSRLPVAVVLPITKQWFSTGDGTIFFPAAEFCSAQHCVLIVGHDDTRQYFTFQNSWSREWGDGGYGKLPYGYIEQYCTDAIAPVEPEVQWRASQPCPVGNGRWLIETCIVATPARSAIYAVCVFDATTNDDIGWAFAFMECDTLDIEEFFVVPRHRRQSVGRVLKDSLQQLSRKVSKPIRYWLPHIDQVSQGQDILDIAYSFGMRVYESEVKWAAKKMLQRPVAVG